MMRTGLLVLLLSATTTPARARALDGHYRGTMHQVIHSDLVPQHLRDIKAQVRVGIREQGGAVTLDTHLERLLGDGPSGLEGQSHQVTGTIMGPKGEGAKRAIALRFDGPGNLKATQRLLEHAGAPGQLVDAAMDVDLVHDSAAGTVRMTGSGELAAKLSRFLPEVSVPVTLHYELKADGE
jgi:hypothetical protein